MNYHAVAVGHRDGVSKWRQSAPKLGRFDDLIVQILDEDESAPPKQRHTAVWIFALLRDEHAYDGGYDAVRRFVKKHRTQNRETFFPLDHEPASGHLYVDFSDGQRQVPVLILACSYSNTPFAVGLTTIRHEALTNIDSHQISSVTDVHRRLLASSHVHDAQNVCRD